MCTCVHFNMQGECFHCKNVGDALDKDVAIDLTVIVTEI